MQKVNNVKEFEDALERYWTKNSIVYEKYECSAKNFCNKYEECVFIHELPSCWNEMTQDEMREWHNCSSIDFITRRYSSMFGCYCVNLMTDENWTTDRVKKYICNTVGEPYIIDFINAGLVKLCIESKQSMETRIKKTPRDIQMKKEYKVKLYAILKEIGITKYNDYYQDISIV